MNVIYDKSTQKVPIKVWSPIDQVEPQAVQQLKNIANLPFVFKHVAAMPDVHLGKGATVGSVVATKGAVIPSAVGVDIGCGMMAIKLDVEPARIADKVHEIRHSIERSVPVGHESNKEAGPLAQLFMKELQLNRLHAAQNHPRGEKSIIDKSALQLGTLGGGNHFIELCVDQDGSIWVMLHSGSRNLGNVIATMYIDKAKDWFKKMFWELSDPELAYFAQGTQDFAEYLWDLQLIQEYAMMNRRVMMQSVLRSISFAIGNGNDGVPLSMEINCHHNYASMENHYGENVLVTRKGAVRARQGDLGIIPGSMGTRSYIVEGLGNPDSFQSCSHGAGRRISRSQARKEFSISDLIEQTAGVDCRKDDGVLDEIPGAYKDIDQVMANQKDLVRVVATLKQFMCIKG